MIYIDLEIHRHFLIRDLVPLRNRLVAAVTDGRLKELLGKARQGLDKGEGEELKNRTSNFVQTFIQLRHKINEIFKNLDQKIANVEQRIEDPEDNQGLKQELSKLVSEAEDLEDVALETIELWEKNAPEGYVNVKIQLQAALDKVQSLIEHDLEYALESLKQEADVKTSSPSLFTLIDSLRSL